MTAFVARCLAARTGRRMLLVGSGAGALASGKASRSARRPGVPSGIRTRVPGSRIRLPRPASRWGPKPSPAWRRERGTRWVGAAGFEPAVSCPPDRRSSRLSHAPGREEVRGEDVRALGGSRTREMPFRRRPPFRSASRAVVSSSWRADRESNPDPRFCRSACLARGPAQGADSGSRTRACGVETRCPTSGPCPRECRGAVKGNRTPVASLAASRSTIELPPQVQERADSRSRTCVDRVGSCRLDR
jgi:hypothetical protein